MGARAGSRHGGIREAIAIAVVVLAAVAGLTSPTPAFAHAQLLSSTPSDGERLATAPTSATLEFSGDVLALGTLIVVADASGSDWAGPPEVDGRRVTAPLRAGMPDAGYEIRWRAVSSDGHPFSGVISFTVGDGEAFSSIDRTPSSRPAEADTPTAAARGDGAASSIPAAPNFWRVALIGLGGAVSATAGYLIFRALRRRRPRAAPVSSTPAVPIAPTRKA